RKPARHGSPFLRSLRNQRWEVRLDRIDRSKVLRRAVGAFRTEGPGAAAPDGSLGMAGTEGATDRDLQEQDARRMVQNHGGQRRVLRSGAEHGRSAAASAQSPSRD